MESLEGLAEVVRDLGVPVVVLLWFMLRVEKRMDKQTEVMTQLVEIVRGLGR